ncbi:MAG: mannosyltransferase family protein, partial [Cyanobacteria bacterium J06639_1]
MKILQTLLPKSQLTRRIVITSIAYQILLGLLTILFTFVNQDRVSIERMTSLFGNWDSRAYIYLSQYGYQLTGDEANFIAFYPLYPFLIRTVNTVIPSPHLSALSISWVTSIVGHIAFFLYLRDLGFEKERIWRIALLLFLSPIAIFFSIAYTESLFFAETALFLYFLHHKKYNFCIICGVFAS